MFEFEVDFSPLAPDQVPEETQNAFRDCLADFQDFQALSLLMWEEHCTECAMPECYSTCDLFMARKDGKCRRFIGGISKFGVPGTPLDYIINVRFKRWGSLMARNQIEVIDSQVVQAVEAKLQRIENLARTFPDQWLSIAGRRGISSRLARRYKRSVVEKTLNDHQQDLAEPSHFVMYLYNQGPEIVDITLVIRAEHGDKQAFPYQKRFKLNPGFSKEEISFSDISSHVSPGQSHFILVVPNEPKNVELQQSLFFGFIGFVRKAATGVGPAPATSDELQAKTVKIVAWDLDNTMWNGILVEETATSKVQLMSGIKHIITELDRRGIVNSVISKNDHDNALNKLKDFGIDKFFVFPEISWEPKSIAMSNLIKNFNVGADTVVFIDDSPFEREEVSSQHPLVRVIDATEYNQILDRPEFNPSISAESGQRRQSYKNQHARIQEKSQFDGNYFEFIKSCEIEVLVQPGTMSSIDRIHELIQRTNQMNFSGNRYSESQLAELLQNQAFETFRLQCRDKFGDYGTVGFCVVKSTDITMVDLAFSCRVQSKRVEHAFLTWLLGHFKDAGSTSFLAVYNQTEKNVQSGRVFQDLGFSVAENIQSRFLFEYDLTKEIPNENLVSVTFKSE